MDRNHRDAGIPFKIQGIFVFEAGVNVKKSNRRDFVGSDRLALVDVTRRDHRVITTERRRWRYTVLGSCGRLLFVPPEKNLDSGSHNNFITEKFCKYLIVASEE